MPARSGPFGGLVLALRCVVQIAGFQASGVDAGILLNNVVDTPGSVALTSGLNRGVVLLRMGWSPEGKVGL